jgi:hypothetical protein
MSGIQDVARRGSGGVADQIRDVCVDPVRLGAAGADRLGVVPVGQRRDDERSDEQGAAWQHLCSGGVEHDVLRNVLVRTLSPRALRPVKELIIAESERSRPSKSRKCPYLQRSFVGRAGLEPATNGFAIGRS